MKKPFILHSSFFILHSTLLAAVPLRWTVETSRVQPVAFDAVHGETLALEATFNSYGKPLALPLNAALFYQTNGMDSAWWTVPATVTSNRIAAVFAPTNDPGASAVTGFLGSTGDIYRAAFTLRFRHGPGASPNAIAAPVPILDLAGTTVVNPPWPTTNDFRTATNLMQSALKEYVDSEIGGAGVITPAVVTNIVDAKIADIPKEGVSTNAVSGIITNHVDSGYLCTVVATSNMVDGIVSPVATTVSSHASQLSQMSQTVTQWSTYWDGDDVRVTVTNYDSSVNLPSFYLEQRTNETALATNLFKTVWTEMGHWTAFLGTNWNWRASWGGFKTWMENVTSELAEKADRAWGFYDSHTGLYAPDGYTQISSSNVMIAAGMSYQKTVTTSAEVWVLTANEPYEPTGVSTNGGFQIKDSDGNVQFEIVKGDKVTVAAQANAATVDSSTTPNTLVVTYNIVASQHPTAEVCLDLSTANWKAETAADCPATVTWSGSSGAYVARIQPNAATAKCFCKATYQRGGDTYINNRCAVGMSQIVLNGTTYNLGTATISGNTVLTLTPAN